ncbi:MAG TPA: MBL fold metallo-hydrolase [Candidatus Methylacidiphilales bacterium]|nr:MBL fold metallo-hydrolase [Candidatus Methylacidiphilales bacterium]
MILTNLTRTNEIGANSYLLDFGPDGRIVLDAGMHPRAEGIGGLPQLEKLKFDSVQTIVVSHAHHDHTGALPLLMRDHPGARVFMSEPTYFLAEPLLHNSVQVMLKQKMEKGIVEYPLFTHRELDQLVKVWQACGLERSWSPNGYPDPENESLTFSFHDAGHILGSVGTALRHHGRTIFYTGDVNFTDQTLARAAEFPREEVDILITETTRGSQPRPESFSRDQLVEQLAEALEQTFAKGGAALMPVFAMGKTQELLAQLHFLQKSRRLPETPIYIGGLGRTFCEIYDRLAARTRRRYPKLRLLDDIECQVMDGRRARDFNPKRGHIYLISSGMMTENTLSNVFAQEFLAQERHSIFFVGYCDPESPAGRLRATRRGDSVTLNAAYGPQPVRCRVEHFDFTSHAQRDDLLRYILDVKPRVCVLVHGDPPALTWFQQQLATEAPGMKVVIPAPGVEIEL